MRAGGSKRAEQARATRRAIVEAAERLFAEQGLHAVSNRQISIAAGQGNNAAVNYHFGTQAELVREIVRRRTAPIGEVRREMVAAAAGSHRVRDWVACLVEPVARHVITLPQPTWYFRFSAQLAADPALRDVAAEEAMSIPSLAATIDGLASCLPDLPDDVRAARGEMTSLLILPLYAAREREVAADPGSAAARWTALSATLVDALAGLWAAPVQPRPAPLS